MIRPEMSNRRLEPARKKRGTARRWIGPLPRIGALPATTSDQFDEGAVMHGVLMIDYFAIGRETRFIPRDLLPRMRRGSMMPHEKQSPDRLGDRSRRMSLGRRQNVPCHCKPPMHVGGCVRVYCV